MEVPSISGDRSGEHEVNLPNARGGKKSDRFLAVVGLQGWDLR